MIARTLLSVLVVAHMCIIVANVAAFFLAPFFTSWYIAVPLCTYIFNLAFNKEWSCPLTDFENKLRVKLGMPKINKFIGHYIKKPICILFGVKKQEHREVVWPEFSLVRED